MEEKQSTRSKTRHFEIAFKGAKPRHDVVSRAQKLSGDIMGVMRMLN